MSDTPEKPKKTHVDVRREAAQSFAIQIASALAPTPMTRERSLELAAQCWTDETTKDRVMDVQLAEAFAKRLEAATHVVVDQMQMAQLVDKIESIMLLAEKRGVHASIEFLNAYIKTLRLSLTNGVANHINQGVIQLAMWLDGSSNFITQGQQEAMRDGSDVTLNRAAEAMAKDEAKDKAPTEQKPKVVNIRKFMTDEKDPEPKPA